MLISDIAHEIFLELDSPSDTSEAAIAFWLETNIGKLNNLIDTDFYVDSGEIVLDFGETEKAIYKTLYNIHYYTRQVNRNLGAAAYASISEVKEGNRTVRRTNKNDIAKTYRGLVADLNDELMSQVLNYKMNHADPLQLIVPNPILTENDPTNHNIRYDRSASGFDLM